MLSHFECNAIGQVELVKGHLAFTIINLFPKIFVISEQHIPLANDVLMRSCKHCIVANSIKTHLVHHGEVLVDAHPVKTAG
jgi:hypothetical protein